MTTASLPPLLDLSRNNTPSERDELRLLDDLHHALAELAQAEDAERRRDGAPELLEARSLRAANAVIRARLALRRLQARVAGSLGPQDERRVAADLAVLALPPRDTSPRGPLPRRGRSWPGRSHR